MLKNFRELGIEIHNAYGMTEAPLVTLNRLGSLSPEGSLVLKGRKKELFKTSYGNFTRPKSSPTVWGRCLVASGRA